MNLVSNLTNLFFKRISITRTIQTAMPRSNKSNQWKQQQPSGKCLVWVDCEMTGLDANVDKILEVAVIITDGQLQQVDLLGPLVAQTPKSVLDNMNEWCKTNHGASGLVQACLDSQLTIEQIDDQLYDLCQRHSITKGYCDFNSKFNYLTVFWSFFRLLAGNSVSYDRIFLQKYCPKFASCLHYRTVDVSTIKELVRIWYKKEKSFKKDLAHRAIDDIKESIDELKYYREHFFRNQNEIDSIKTQNQVSDANSEANHSKEHLK